MAARFEHCSPDAADIRFDGDRVVGAALWDPPSFRPPLWRRLVCVPAFVAAMGPGPTGPGASLSQITQSVRPTRPHWYLAQLGAVETGQGHGSALLDHRLTTITGPAYLESSNIRNVPLYERHGFSVTGEVAAPGGPTLWCMWRDV